MIDLSARSTHPAHVRGRTIVLRDLRVLYVPVPKAGCTSLLWLMAALNGRTEADFIDSRRPSVSPDMSVHDPAVWEAGLRLIDYDPATAGEMWTSDRWFRFTVVREPVARIWSSWQSKLLLREPGFVKRFGDSGWIPDPPTSAEQVRSEFLRFVRGVAVDDDDSPRDVHWASQAGLLGDLPFTHVGRIERLDETLHLLRDHVGTELPVLRRANPTPLPFEPALLNEPARAMLSALTSDDRARFGYVEMGRPVDAEGDIDRWSATIEPLLPLIRELVRRHERIDQLAALARTRRRGPARPRTP